MSNGKVCLRLQKGEECNLAQDLQKNSADAGVCGFIGSTRRYWGKLRVWKG